MDVQTIMEKVKEAIWEVTRVDPATISGATSYTENLGLDSLSILEIAVSVEDEFKLKFTDEELSSIRTVEDTVELVRKRIPVEVA